MTVIDKIIKINDEMKEIFEFTQENSIIKNDFDEYLATLGIKEISSNKMEKIFLPYIFERRIETKSILEIFKEDKQKEGLIDSLINSQSSIYEIKKVLRNGFELYNIINEKSYTVSSLTKMSNFKGIYSGQFIVARIFNLDNEYYVIEISSILSHSQKEDAYRYAVMKLVQNPSLLYLDNKEKEEEIKNTINEMYSKFTTTFNTDLILTTNRHADDIIGAFNENEKIDLSDKMSKVEKYKFFHVKELDNNYANFLENSMGGFASHNEIYDVAVIFDKETGLYAIPFYETFAHIFINKENVENAKDCVEYFLTNSSIHPNIINKLFVEYPNFINEINNILETDYTYEELIKTYKSEFLNNKIYSSATILFCSKAFSEIFEFMSNPKEENLATPTKIGRNSPCPCGSGKKFKYCCGS